jgi:hypothetical protein
MFDFDLSLLYEVETRILKQAVRRNIDRFPDDFLIQLTKNEWQKVITICDNLPAKVRYSPVPPFAFTEQGIAMISSILKSKTAIQVNISIMRAFVYIRQYALSNKELTNRLNKLESNYNKKFKDVYIAINFLLSKDKQKTEQRNRKRIGFKSKDQ